MAGAGRPAALAADKKTARFWLASSCTAWAEWLSTRIYSTLYFVFGLPACETKGGGGGGVGGFGVCTVPSPSLRNRESEVTSASAWGAEDQEQDQPGHSGKHALAILTGCRLPAAKRDAIFKHQWLPLCQTTRLPDCQSSVLQVADGLSP
jgi:hypothetical protein